MLKHVVRVLLVTATAVIATATPAAATTITFQSEVARTQDTVVLGCPAGERFVSGTADWYRRQGGKLLATTQATVAPGDPSSGVYVKPRGARYVVITQECTPTTQTITVTGTQGEPGALNEVNCPAETPWLVQVVEVTDTTLNAELSRTVTATGVQFWTQPGNTWRVTLTCSYFQPAA